MVAYIGEVFNFDSVDERFFFQYFYDERFISFIAEIPLPLGSVRLEEKMNPATPAKRASALTFSYMKSSTMRKSPSAKLVLFEFRKK